MTAQDKVDYLLKVLRTCRTEDHFETWEQWAIKYGVNKYSRFGFKWTQRMIALQKVYLERLDS